MDVKREIVLNLKGKAYIASFPTIGQLRNIEALKQELSRGQYGAMVQSGLKTQWEAIELIEIEATLTTLFPKFMETLEVPLSQIDALDFKDVMREYKTKFTPWFNDWYKLFSEVDEKK